MNVQNVHLCTVWTKSFSLQGISLQKTFREYYYSCLSNRILKNVLFWPKLNVWGSIVTKPNWNKTFPTAAVINSYAKVILHKCRFVVELYKCSIGQKHFNLSRSNYRTISYILIEWFILYLTISVDVVMVVRWYLILQRILENVFCILINFYFGHQCFWLRL